MTTNSLPIIPPPRVGYYEEREADLCQALRQRVAALAPDGEQELVMEAWHAGWGLTEICRAIKTLKNERPAHK